MQNDQQLNQAGFGGGMIEPTARLNHNQIDDSINRLESITQKIFNISARISGEDNQCKVEPDAKDTVSNISLRELLCGSRARIDDHIESMNTALNQLESNLF